MTVRVVHVVPDLDPTSGGPAENVPRLCAALGAQGLQVELHTIGADTGPHAAGIALRRAPGAWPARLGRSPALAKALLGAPADVFHAHCLWQLPLGYAARAARAQGVPLVISPRGMLAEWALERSPFKKLLARLLLHPGALRQAAGWHATSAQEADEIRRRGLKQPICVSPNGIEASSQDPNEAREVYLGLAPELRGRRVALFYSRFHSKKRVRELLDDFAALAGTHRDWHLLVVGIPEQWGVAELLAQAQRLGLAQRVSVLDGRALPKPYPLAELFVLPTHNENFGRVVAEALAAGLPVLTTTGTPWSELESARAGRWVPLGGLRAALSELLASPASELREMGARGQRLVLERYAWPAVVRPLLDFYRELGGARVKFCALVLTQDEELQLPGCLDSLRAAERIVLIDSGSKDRTLEIARARLRIEVLERPFRDFAAQRNFGLQQFTPGIWVLHLDADERLTDDLQAELEGLVPAPEAVAYNLAPRTFLGSRSVARAAGFPVYQTRLTRAGAFAFEQVGHGQKAPAALGALPHLHAPYEHHPFEKGFEHWRARHERYAADEARELRAAQGKPRAAQALVDPIARRQWWKHTSARWPLRPELVWLHLMVLRLGLLDGPAGWEYCRLRWLYERMVRRALRGE